MEIQPRQRVQRYLSPSAAAAQRGSVGLSITRIHGKPLSRPAAQMSHVLAGIEDPGELHGLPRIKKPVHCEQIGRDRSAGRMSRARMKSTCNLHPPLFVELVIEIESSFR